MTETRMGDSDLADLLGQARPTRLDAVMADESVQKIAVPNKGQKWARLVRILAPLPWVELRCLNAKGELVAPVISRGPAAEMEPLEMTAGTGTIVQLNGIAQMFSAVTREAMRTAVDGLTKMRESGRGEIRDILEAHKDLSREFAAQLAVETTRRLQAEHDLDEAKVALLELRGEIASRSASTEGDARGSMLEGVIGKMAEKWIGDGGAPADAAAAAKGGDAKKPS